MFVGITSRTPHFQRDDVTDRLLVFFVRRFEEGEFVAEHLLLDEVLQHRDRIMTVLVENLQEVIRALKETTGRTYKTCFRMADFATFALRIADVEGGRAKMEGLFGKMADEQAAFTLDGDTFLELLWLWLAVDGNNKRPVKASTFHSELKALAEEKHMDFGYRNGKALGQRINNAEHNLRKIVGISITTDPHLKQKLYSFWKLV